MYLGGTVNMETVLKSIDIKMCIFRDILNMYTLIIFWSQKLVNLILTIAKKKYINIYVNLSNLINVIIL